MALKRLTSEYKGFLKDPNYYYSIAPTDDFLRWNFSIIGPPDTFYEFGIFPGYINFTSEYPNKAPDVVFSMDMIHPNIYKNGKVCISILHEGTDQYGYESDMERWLPTHGVNTIMMSIISLLSSPNFESPANIEASKLWKDNIEDYKKVIYQLVSKTQT